MPSYSGVFNLQTQMQAKAAGNWPPFAPNAPTIGTATATGSTTATVSFTAPTFDGGSAITSYTATSSPGGITGTLNQAGSGTITVSGLSPLTAYTFTVSATNAIGTGSASSASNSITTQMPNIGEAFGGGFFAGQISTTGNGVANFNLAVSPKSSGQATRQWKTSNTGGDPTSVIDGPANSAAMNSSTYPAAQFCEGLSIGGFSDWYMPATNELEVCYFNLKPTTAPNDTSSGINTNAVPSRGSNYTSGTPGQTSASNFRSTGAEFFDSQYYWSSTQASLSQRGQYQYFLNGNQFREYKTTSVRVRAIRRVAV